MRIARAILRAASCIDAYYLWNEPMEWTDKFLDFFKNYATVVRGDWISGFFNKYDHVELSESSLSSRVEEGLAWCRAMAERHPQLYFPALEADVQAALQQVPCKYRYFGFLQRQVIELNDPSLMRYGYTSFNLRKRLARRLYWSIIRFY